jgi:hypothetical protein
MGSLRSLSLGSSRVGAAAASLSIIVAACGAASNAQPATPTTAPSASVASGAPTPAFPSALPSPSVAVAATPAIGSIVPEAVFQPDGTVATIQVTDDALWVFDLTGVLRIDPATNTSTHVSLTVEGGGPSVNGAIGFDSIWAGDFDLGQVRRYDETSGDLRATIETENPEGVLATDDGVWVANHHTGTVSRIDFETDQIAVQIEVGHEGSSGPKGLIEAGGDVWVGIPNEGKVTGVDPDKDAPDGEIETSFPGGPCGPMSTYGSRIYIGGCNGDTSMEVVDYGKLESVASISLGGPSTQPVMVGDRLWFGVGLDTGGLLMSMDPESLEPSPGPAATGGYVTNIAVGFESVWVGVEGDGGAWLLRLPESSLSE